MEPVAPSKAMVLTVSLYCVRGGVRSARVGGELLYNGGMPALDRHHTAVRNALIKDGWTITADALTLFVGEDRVHTDLGAERVIAADNGTRKIAVEVKTFGGASKNRRIGNCGRAICGVSHGTAPRGTGARTVPCRAANRGHKPLRGARTVEGVSDRRERQADRLRPGRGDNSTMATLSDKALARTVLTELAAKYHVPKVRTLTVFDDETGNYLLMDEGWQGYKRLHHVWAHIETTDGKFYVHEDGTEEGIANRLMATGVPQNRIVLALDAPTLRAESGFAFA